MSAAAGVIEGYRLSPLQAAWWNAHNGRQHDRVECLTRITGDVDGEVLRRALEAVVAAHDILRTRFPQLAGMKLPLQVVEDGASVSWRAHDLTGHTAAEQADTARKALDAARLKAAGPDRDAVMHATLVTLAPGDALLHVSLPALAADARTLPKLMHALCRAYDAVRRGHALPPAEVQYVQFSEWQHEILAGDDAESAAAYWRRQGVPGTAGLRLPPADPAGLRHEGLPAVGWVGRSLDGNLAARTRALAARIDADTASILLGCWSCLLYRLTGQAEISVEVAFDGRVFDELEDAPGRFDADLPVRLHLQDGHRFDDVVRRIATIAGEHRDWQEYGAALLDRAEGSAERQGARAMFEHLEHPATYQAGDVNLRIVELRSPFDPGALRLSCRSTPDELEVGITYDDASFDRRGVERLLESYVTLLASATEASHAGISSLEVLSVSQRDEILIGLNPDSDGDAPAESFPVLFERQVERTPEAIAAALDGATLTYAQLDAHASALAARLRSLGVGPEVPVGLCLEHTLEALVGIVAILKSGGAYVPVDPGDPADRLALILRDAGAPVVITDARMAGELRAGRFEAVVVDLGAEPGATPRHGVWTVDPASIAYVIYTSGSTGSPKGVAVEHRSLAGYLRWVNDTLIDGLPLPAVTKPTFDASLKQLLAPLLRGDEVWLVLAGAATDPERLYRALCRRPGPNGLNCVPSLWQALLDIAASDPRAELRGHLRRVLIGGERLAEQLVTRTGTVLPGCEVWNLYGPTEATANASAGPAGGDLAVSIGRPIDGARIYLLDGDLRPVPLGVPGRLYIGGAAVARGYWRRPGETAPRFVPDPFSGTPGSRMYDSGDLARYLPDGRIEFLGREDLQVKIRGFRIELEGVEASLRAVQGVADAAAGVRELPDGGRVLVAFVVGDAGQRPSTGAVRDELTARLPAYMVPGSLVAVDALPRTATGKLDRRALAGIETDAGGADGVAVAPRTMVEEELIGVWGRLLGTAQVAPSDGFFELGGHSLLVIQLMSRVRDAFGIELPPQALFEAPTLREFAERVERALADRRGLTLPPVERVPRTGELPLSFAQQRLWILDRLEPSNPRYNVMASRRITGSLDTAALQRSVDEIIRRHEVLRTAFRWDREGDPRQVILPRVEVPTEIVDLRGTPAPEREAAVRRYATEQARRPFDLREPPLLRVSLLRLAADDAVMVMVVHHIVCDGWAKSVFYKELAALYKAFVAGGEPQLPELPIQYADYAAWERRWLSQSVLDEQLGHWRQQLRDLPVLDLPTDHPRPPIPAYLGRTAHRAVPEALMRSLKELATGRGATLFMTVLAAFKVLLARYSGQEDVVIGTAMANRNRAELQDLIGFFVNTVVLRTDLSGDPAFSELLRRVRDVALAAYANQDVPFERLVEELRPERDRSRSPLFQVMFAFVPLGEPETPLGGGATLRQVEVESGSALFDLTLSVIEEPEGLQLFLNHDTGLFEADTATRMLGDLETVLAAATTDPDMRISALPPAVQMTGQGKSPPATPAGVNGDADEPAAAAAPSGPVARQLSAIWAELFDAPSVAAEDDFFALGGHSLLALQMMAWIEDTFGIELPLFTLFEAPTFGGLMACVERALAEAHVGSGDGGA